MKSCSGARQLAASLALLASALVLSVSFGNVAVEASIEKETVRVTHHNSGPRYDIDEVERTRLNAESSENQVIPPASRGGPFLGFPPRSSATDSSDQKPAAKPEAGAAPEGSSGEPEHVGHISIRRIFLIPMSNPDWQGQNGGQSGRQQQGEESNPIASLFGSGTVGPSPSVHHRASAPSFWPFLLRPSHHEHDQQQPPPPHHPGHHLFGADEASRPPVASGDGSPAERNEQPSRGGEREVDSMLAPHSNESPQRPLIDPIQMMIDMMQQALNPNPSAGGNSNEGFGGNIFSDLNKEASANGPQAGGEQEKDKPKTELESTAISKPNVGSKNETREDVVEIEGKKYLRKTVTSKSVGDNIIFMTKRLIFTPLNEATTGESATPAQSTGEQPRIPIFTPPTPSRAGTADTLPDIVKEEPERRKIDEVASGASNEPTNVSAAPPEPAPTSETPSVPTNETKPSNPETSAATEAPVSTTRAPIPEETTLKSLVDRVTSEGGAERLMEQEKPTPSSSTNTKPL